MTRLLHPRLVFGLSFAVVACGGTVEHDRSSGGSGAGAGTSTGAQGTGATGTGGAGATGTGGAGGATGGSGGFGASGGDVEWAVEAWPGGLDHLIVMRADEAAGFCIRMFIDAPIDGWPQVSVPEPWGLSEIAAYEGTTGCLDGTMQPPGAYFGAVSAGGVISWDLDPGDYYPCELSVDVTASFSQPPPWLPASVAMQAVDVPVDGGCF